MAQAHARRFNEIRGCQVVACCDILPGRAAEFAKTHNIPAAYENTKSLFASEKLDAITVVTPDNAHYQAVMDGIKQGLHIMCEKPLADNLQHARKMAAAAHKKGILTCVNFTYRNNPATQKAAQIVASGKLGRILHAEGSYLQSWLASDIWGHWKDSPHWLWRLSTKHGSAGCLGDIGVHLYDLAQFVVGDIAEIACRLETFDKGTPKVGEYTLDANDAFVSQIKFQNGSIGVLHSSRWASGHANTVAIRVFGDRGALDLNLDRESGQELRTCIGKKAMKEAKWKYEKCPNKPDQYQRFITSIKTGQQAQSSFQSAADVQACLHYSMISDTKGKSVKVK